MIIQTSHVANYKKLQRSQLLNKSCSGNSSTRSMKKEVKRELLIKVEGENGNVVNNLKTSTHKNRGAMFINES